MTKRTLKHLALSLPVLGLALIPASSLAQVRLGAKLPGKGAASSATQAARSQAQTSGSPSYTYTLLDYPGSLATVALSINKGATTSRTEIVGGYNDPNGYMGSQGGFVVKVSGTKTVTEIYRAVNYPNEPPGQNATGVNDLGQIVGIYSDSSGVEHGYELNGAKFTTLDVPFAGATGTYSLAINDSGEVVGCWTDSDGNDHGFTLLAGAYTSFDYPGGPQTCAYGVNNAGDIVGEFAYGSFLLSGGTYSPLAFPGAVLTYAVGINDAGDIAGSYCLTNGECETNGEGSQGFLLSGGSFTTIDVPGEFYTDVTDVNNNGVVVGYYEDAAGVVGGFMATP